MLFVIRFTDRADRQDVREQYLQAHIEWLDQRRDVILVAGSLRQDPDHNPVGAMWVVEAKSKDDLDGLFESDPFWKHGLRKSFEILHWSKAFPEERSIL